MFASPMLEQTGRRDAKQTKLWCQKPKALVWKQKEGASAVSVQWQIKSLTQCFTDKPETADLELEFETLLSLANFLVHSGNEPTKILELDKANTVVNRDYSLYIIVTMEISRICLQIKTLLYELRPNWEVAASELGCSHCVCFQVR